MFEFWPCLFFIGDPNKELAKSNSSRYSLLHQTPWISGDKDLYITLYYGAGTLCGTIECKPAYMYTCIHVYSTCTCIIIHLIL